MHDTASLSGAASPTALPPPPRQPRLLATPVQDEAVQNILFMTFCVFVSSFGAIFNIDIYALIVEPLDAINRPWGIDSLNEYFHRSTLPSSV